MPKDDYLVGYRKPPLHTQFQKGKSGNPKGRPRRKNQDFYELLDAELWKRIPIREGNKTIILAKIEVLIKSLVNNSCKGDKGMMRLLLKLLENYEEKTGNLLPPHESALLFLKQMEQNAE